jgi:hypothetical protein
MTITRKGNVVAPEAAHSILPACAYRVRNWVLSCAPKWQSETHYVAAENGYETEYYFDAAHGCAMLLLVYSGNKERRDCINYLCGE